MHEGAIGTGLPVRMYWWDQKKNFGDLIGPWLVQKISGRQVVNTMWEEEGRDAPGLLTVGSLLHSLRRPGLDVWGAGSMMTLNAAYVERLSGRRPRKIHAIRGWRTYKELSTKLGWDVPKVYGDPALLLPRFHRPRQGGVAAGRIAIVPHYFHKAIFDSAGPEFHVVDVARDPEVVVDEIASSRACISTSLHGVIVAHAYGVPWTWLRVADHPLRGDTFKFEDFFTVMDRSAVSAVSMAKEDCSKEPLLRIANDATVPRNKFSFDDLLESFPHDSI